MSTSPDPQRGTWIGGGGLGGCTNGGSYWYKYWGRSGETITWILYLGPGPSADYDLKLWSYPNPDTLLAQAISVSYPDTLTYAFSSGRYV